MLQRDDVAVARAGHEDIAFAESAFDGLHLEALHRRLQGADRVDLGHDNARSVRTHRSGAPLAHVAVAAHDHHLAGDHHVGRTLDAVGQRLAAAVEVVEFRLGAGVIDVDGRNEQFARFLHLVEPVYARSGLLADALPFGHRAVPFILVLGKHLLQRVDNHLLFIGGGFVIERRSVVLGFEALVNQKRRIAAVVHDQLRAFAARKRQRHGRTPPVFGQRLALPCENGNARLGNRGGGMVLRREDVARTPAHVGAQFHEGLDQHGGLDGHMQRTHDAHAFQRLLRTVLAAHGHQSGHFVLGDLDLFASPPGQRHVGYLVGHCQV